MQPMGLLVMSDSSWSRFFQFLASFLIPGLGMTCEAYVIFSVGNLKRKPTLQHANSIL